MQASFGPNQIQIRIVQRRQGRLVDPQNQQHQQQQGGEQEHLPYGQFFLPVLSEPPTPVFLYFFVEFRFHIHLKYSKKCPI